MTRGKHASSAEARRVREEAVATAARLEKENAKIAAERDALQARVQDLRVQLAEGVSGELTKARADAVALLAENRRQKELLSATAKAILTSYDKTVRTLVKSGYPHAEACDFADAVTTSFLIGGELLSPGEVAATWAGGKLDGIVKRPRHKMGMGSSSPVGRVDEMRNEAAVRRQDGGIVG